MIVAVPSATEVTRPVEETVATPVSDDDQITVAPDMTVPPQSFAVALNVTVSPNDAKVLVPGDTSTVDAT